MIKKELEPLLLFLVAPIVFSLLTISGIIFNLIESFIMLFQVRFWKGLIHFIVYWLKIIYQIWNAIKYLLLHVAISEDLIGNATGGKLVERIVTDDRNTLYGEGSITISAATGAEETKGTLNKDGRWFTGMLSYILGARHSINAYLSELKKD